MYLIKIFIYEYFSMFVKFEAGVLCVLILYICFIIIFYCLYLFLVYTYLHVSLYIVRASYQFNM